MDDQDGTADRTDFPFGSASSAEAPLICASCGRPLGESSDDQPYWPGGPICGDCYQARQMDDEIWWSEQDGGV